MGKKLWILILAIILLLIGYYIYHKATCEPEIYCYEYREGSLFPGIYKKEIPCQKDYNWKEYKCDTKYHYNDFTVR